MICDIYDTVNSGVYTVLLQVIVLEYYKIA